jgi:hypothetical protein
MKENAEAQLREIQLALKHCELDYEEILEDYREHLKYLEKLKEQRSSSRNMTNQQRPAMKSA